MPSPNPPAPPVTIATLPSSCYHGSSSSAAGDLGIERVAVRLAAQKGFDQRLRRALPARRENRLPVTTADRRDSSACRQTPTACRAPAPATTCSRNSPLRSRPSGGRSSPGNSDPSTWPSRVLPFNSAHVGIARRRHAGMQLHVVARILALPRKASALPILARRIELLDLRGRQARALRTDFANNFSASSRRAHSSNICDGASTKSRLTDVPL